MYSGGNRASYGVRELTGYEDLKAFYQTNAERVFNLG
jgi:hypothetical protein